MRPKKRAAAVGDDGDAGEGSRGREPAKVTIEGPDVPCGFGSEVLEHEKEQLSWEPLQASHLGEDHWLVMS